MIINTKEWDIHYPCDKCEYSATSRSHRREHIDNKQEGVRYPCDKCEFSATSRSYLRVHIKNKHERVSYPCDKCEFSATYRSHLIEHIENKHEGVRYPCDKCKHSATRQNHLSEHIKNKCKISTVLNVVFLQAISNPNAEWRGDRNSLKRRQSVDVKMIFITTYKHLNREQCTILKIYTLIFRYLSLFNFIYSPLTEYMYEFYIRNLMFYLRIYRN